MRNEQHTLWWTERTIQGTIGDRKVDLVSDGAFKVRGKIDDEVVDDKELLRDIFIKYETVASLQDQDRPGKKGFLGFGKSEEHQSVYAKQADDEISIKREKELAKQRRALAEEEDIKREAEAIAKRERLKKGLI